VAFDKTQPTDTTKIRNLGVVIRPNWVAIEQGDDTFRPLAENLQNRTPSALPPDPTLLADTSKLYCKEDGSGVAELFNMDATGQIIQLTEDGNMGGQTTGIYTNGVSVSMAELRQIHKTVWQPSAWFISNGCRIVNYSTNWNFGDLTVWARRSHRSL
jgi:hypothetical protein